MELNVSNSISVGGYCEAAISFLSICIGFTFLSYVAAFLGIILGVLALQVALRDSKATHVATVAPSANRTTEVHAIKSE